MGGHADCQETLLEAGTNKSSCADVAHSLSAVAHECCFLESYQRTYWDCAVVLLTLSLLSLVRLAYEARVNANMRRRPVTYFYVMLSGDLLFVIVYLSYHIFNSIELRASGHVDLAEFDAFCKVTFFASTLSVTLTMSGLVLIAYYPYKILYQSMVLFSAQDSSRTAILVALVAAFAGSALWFTLAIVGDHIGSSSGLYCGPTSWNNSQGAMMFAVPALACNFMCYYYWKAYSMIRTAASRGNSGSAATAGSAKTAASRVMHFGALMLTSFFLTCGPGAMVGGLAVLGVRVPIQVEMLGGLMAKLKGFVDMCIMMKLSHVKVRAIAPYSLASGSPKANKAGGTKHEASSVTLTQAR